MTNNRNSEMMKNPAALWFEKGISLRYTVSSHRLMICYFGEPVWRAENDLKLILA